MAPEYRTNHLANVICRVDFPVVLRLSNERPIAFQEALAHLFPKASEGIILEAEVPGGAPQNATLKQQAVRWEFSTRDGSTRVLLQNDFLVVAADKYTDYASFRKLFTPPFEKLKELYSLSVITRLGLRYKNELAASGTDISLVGYLHDALAAHLAFDHGGTLTQERHALWFDKDDVHVILNYGLANPDFPAPIRERRMLVDIDSYIRDDIEPSDVLARLGRLNEEATDVFERCIGEKWRETMRG